MKYCKECGSPNLNKAQECSDCGCTEFEFKCERCGTIFEDMDRCPKCGLGAGRKKQVCPECGEEYFSNACPNCGYSKTKASHASKQKTTQSKPDRVSICGLIGTILGIVAIILNFFGFGIVFGIPAIILGFIGLACAKKRNAKKGLAITALILGFVALLLFILTLAACNAVSDELSKTTSTSITQKVDNPSQTKHQIGEKAEQNGICVTLLNVSESSGANFITPTDGNVFLICEFEIENNTNEDMAVSSLMSFQAYCDGYSTNLSISALSNKGSKQQLDGNIAAEKKMNGVIGFEVPKTWKELEVQFKPSLFGDPLCFVATHQ